MFEERKISEKQREEYRRLGYWNDQTLLDCWEATVEKFPEREYVVDDRGFRYTYRQMDEAAARVAAFLVKTGVRPRDTVSYQLPIWSEFAMLTIACFKAGAEIGRAHV